MTPRAAETLAGVLTLFPGRACPGNIVSTRKDFAAVVTRGVPAARLSGVLGNLYTLCGHAHRLCADMAVAAARGRPDPAHPLAIARLQRDTASEHIRRMTLDWPRQLAAGPGTAGLEEEARQALVQCSVILRNAEPALPTGFEPQPELFRWLETSLLHMPAGEWLACWDQEPAGCLRSWSESSSSWLARWLAGVRATADVQTDCAQALRVHASDAGLRLLADGIAHQPTFTRAPSWRGECAETGTWTRLHQPMPPLANSAWLKLGSRVAELVRLATAPPPLPGRGLLDAGCLALARHEGIAWVEMARGLLLHHVVLDGDGEQARVDACHVLAPTEWNFHPRGAVARLLETMDATPDTAARGELEAMVTSYDPCIRHELMSERASAGARHALRAEDCHA
jgi:hypothetical protein